LIDLLGAFECICAHLVSDVGEEHANLVATGLEPDIAFEQCG